MQKQTPNDRAASRIVLHALSLGYSIGDAVADRNVRARYAMPDFRQSNGRLRLKLDCGDHDEAVTVGKRTVCVYRIGRERIAVAQHVNGRLIHRPGYAITTGHQDGDMVNLPVSDPDAAIAELSRRARIAAEGKV